MSAPILARKGQPVKGAPVDSIDREPLTGRQRNDFEASLYRRVKRSAQLVLRILLDHAAGKAECWPSNKRIAEIAGFQVRNVQLIIRGLEAAELIRCIPDRSLKTQRRIVVLDHPNAVRILTRFRAYAWMQPGAQASDAKPVPRADAGAQRHVKLGAQGSVGVGAQTEPPKSRISPSGELEEKNSLVLSTGKKQTDQAMRQWFRPRLKSAPSPREYGPADIARQAEKQRANAEALRSWMAGRR